MKNVALKIGIILYLALSVENSFSQSLQHPIIWANTAEKESILNKINTVSWAKTLNSQLHARVDDTKDSHKVKPSFLIDRMPEIGNSTTREAHNLKVTMAVESATLYYLTGDEDYAQLSADILSYYTEAISRMDSLTVNIYNNVWYEARNDYSKLAMTYDFIHPFIKKEGGITVYDKTLKTRKAFDNERAQTSMQFMAMMTLNNCAALHYGDSNRQNTVPDELHTRTLAIAHRKDLTELAQKVLIKRSNN